MKVVRRDKALEDLADCALYIAQDDPDVAGRFVDAFTDASETSLDCSETPASAKRARHRHKRSL